MSVATVARLGILGAEQWGLFTTAQARAADVSPQQVARLCAAGGADRVRHGVYRLAGVPDDEHVGLRAAWLALEPERMAGDRIWDPAPAVVSHEAAAALHNVGDLGARHAEFTVPTRRQTRQPEVRFHCRELDASEWQLVEGLPVTTLARTIADLAEARLDGEHLGSVMQDALAAHAVSHTRLTAALAPHAHRYGAPPGDGQSLLELLLPPASDDGLTVGGVELAQLLAGRSAVELAVALAPVGERVMGHLRAADRRCLMIPDWLPAAGNDGAHR